MKKVFLLFFVIITLCCCSSKKKEPVSDYVEAMKNLKNGNYLTSAEMFEKIEDSKPFTKEATNSLIMSSYSYYKAKKYEDSIRVIDYFIQSNPINENIPYMYYLKGLNYYDRMSSVSKARDITERADLTFKELLYRYPYSEYSPDSLNRLSKTETYLSGNEINIGNYYLKRKNYIGAVNHFGLVIKNYPKSSFVPEALYRMVEISSFLNLKFEAVQYYKMMIDDYPENKWTKYATKIVKQYEKI